MPIGPDLDPWKDEQDFAEEERSRRPSNNGMKFILGFIVFGIAVAVGLFLTNGGFWTP